MNKEFVYSDLFKLLPQSSKVSKLELAPDGKTPAYSSDTHNNGCVGFVNKEPLFKITEEVPVYLVFGDHTRTMNIVRKDFCVMDNVKVLAPLFMMSDEVLLYITTCWKKAIPNLGYARHWSVAKTARFELPVIESSDPDHEYTVDDIDWQYMRERIAELERERIAELDAYLTASGLNNYELTDEDKKILSSSAMQLFKEFDLSVLFDISTTKGVDKNKLDFAADGEYDFIGRTSVNWGIQGKLHKLSFEPNPKDSFSLIQVGETVALWREKEWYASQNLFLLTPKIDKIKENKLYFQGVINKEMSRYGKEYNIYPTLKSLAATKILLPVVESPDPDHKYTVADIDFDYMERYIRAIEKLAIADVVRHKDRTIAAAKQIINV